MKKLLALLLALMMLFSIATVFAGCDSSTSKKSSSSDDEKKDDEKKDDEKKDDEKKDDENKGDENKGDEPTGEEPTTADPTDAPVEQKPAIDPVVGQQLEEVVFATMYASFGFDSEPETELVPQDVYDYVEYLYDYTKDDILGGYAAYTEYTQAQLEAAAGANLELTVTIGDCQKMDATDLSKLIAGLELAYGDYVDYTAISDAYRLTVEMTLTGDESTRTNSSNQDCAALCIDGQWYVLRCEEDSDVIYAEFYGKELIDGITSMLEYPELYE